jgi:hypothetical protein
MTFSTHEAVAARKETDPFAAAAVSRRIFSRYLTRAAEVFSANLIKSILK